MNDSSVWTKSGATLSLKNTCKEFGLSEAEIFQAMKSKKLQYRVNYAHGSPYYKLVRSEVKSLLVDLRGENGAQKQIDNEKLKSIDKEIRSLKRKISVLEKQRSELSKGNC